jgi:hypothetical protein
LWERLAAAVIASGASALSVRLNLPGLPAEATLEQIARFGAEAACAEIRALQDDHEQGGYVRLLLSASFDGSEMSVRRRSPAVYDPTCVAIVRMGAVGQVCVGAGASPTQVIIDATGYLAAP